MLFPGLCEKPFCVLIDSNIPANTQVELSMTESYYC